MTMRRTRRPTLHEARVCAGLTQDQLAARAGLAQTTISLIERGRTEYIRRRTRARLALALAVPEASIDWGLR